MKRHIIGAAFAFSAVALALSVLMPLPAAAQQDPAVGGTKRCTAYWNSHKATLKAAGKTKKDFMGPCLSGTWIFQ
jgi:hypothetical protein